MLKSVLLGVGLLTAGLFGADYAARGPEPPPNDPPARRLLPQVDTLLLRRVGWACACPQWSTLPDWEQYGKHENQLARHCLFIEPATPAQELPEDFNLNPTRFDVRVVGQFYARRGYPEGLLPYEGGRRARVFRYTCYELEERTPFRPHDDTTLVVYYDAISCACAHWATRVDRDDPSNRGHIYLEPAGPKLPVADHLWNGRHLPLRLLVTGQFVSQAGYPKGYVTKGDPEPAPVLRYRSLQVLPNQRKAAGRQR